MPQIEMDTIQEYAQIQEFGRSLEDFFIPRSKWTQQVPQRLLAEYADRPPNDVQFGYRTDIGWFAMVWDEPSGLCVIDHLDYPDRVHL